ncbi:bifunctional 5,10-methylenetetrahydrofolate dehydrogenase/5,10-methenyltetrahydrofolate cyclohydrolase [Peptostreptococcus faecalis]|uniref:bifunctional 5,10-methylenetetrahydrofolate dehydrogenase/5,10-methenyltetrahydrofolate cyclohydrolase n=1 Tax=Peptostreptococcus faecalis TaxID=2045015 RepID=UPI000C7B07C8|nr:tetrahydrofolate dehydrogenase/cyclohydrolase catalytic domain-containing protein [Peptostreptococcus faecalis]
MSENKLMKGKAVADHITEDIIKQVEELNKDGIFPKLAMVRVGNDESDLSYQRGATNRFKKCGIETTVVELPSDITQDEYIQAIERLNKDESIHGILCFRPLPKHIDEDVVKYHIDERKDVDCFSPMNLVKVVSNDKKGFAPCTPMGVIEILDYYEIDLVGKNVVVLGRSLVVGKPLSMLLLNRNATVTICHSKTSNLKEVAKKADILISCMGVGNMINRDYIGDNAIVVDVGINFDEYGNMCGDVDTENVLDKVSMITPVPGGVGSVTTSVLARHVLKACNQINELK